MKKMIIAMLLTIGLGSGYIYHISRPVAPVAPVKEAYTMPVFPKSQPVATPAPTVAVNPQLPPPNLVTTHVAPVDPSQYQAATFTPTWKPSTYQVQTPTVTSSPTDNCHVVSMGAAGC